MRIDYVSDLHFESWVPYVENQSKWEVKTKDYALRLFEKRQGEVLVLVGDVSEWLIQIEWILEVASTLYEKVVFTYGNHDLYVSSKSQQEKYGDSIGKLYKMKELEEKIKNVEFLFCKVIEYKGKVFAGDAMWYLPKSLEDKQFYRNVMADAKSMKINGYNMEEVPLVLWKQSMDWYDTLNGQKIDVFVSHTPPAYPPFSIYQQNMCFQVDVPFLAAPHWICGHVHLTGEFEKADTKFYLNCIGTRSECRGAQRNIIPSGELEFDVRTIEI